MESATSPAELGRTLYSLAEVEEIARESGIALDNLHRAIRELDRPRAGFVELFLGGPTSHRSEIEFEARLLEPEQEQVVRRIRKSLGQVGELSTLGNTITWVSRQGSVPIEIVIENDPDRASLAVQLRFEGLIGGLFGGIGGGLGGGASSLWVFAAKALVGSTPLAVGLGLALSFTTALGLARFIYARKVRGHVRRVEALLDELSRPDSK